VSGSMCVQTRRRTRSYTMKSTVCWIVCGNYRVNQTRIKPISTSFHPFAKWSTPARSISTRPNSKGSECGTVHAFQGKEAAIVFLVLGSAPGQSSAGACPWAASKPNLLNVAVTRAKCRLHVIGNASAWGGLAYFGELHRILPVRQSVDVTGF